MRSFFGGLVQNGSLRQLRDQQGPVLPAPLRRLKKKNKKVMKLAEHVEVFNAFDL
jgi:hypothetical protein